MVRRTFSSGLLQLFRPLLIVSGPAYLPVECEFVDELEWLIKSQQLVRVRFWNGDDYLIELYGVASDLVTRTKEDFLVFSSGNNIRLDRIHQIKIIIIEGSPVSCNEHGCRINPQKTSKEFSW